jgi:hypothetical protein
MKTITTAVLFTRGSNENASTSTQPLARWAGQKDLSETRMFCLGYDDNTQVACKIYEVREITLPAWLDADEWATHSTSWAYTWGAGVSMEWSEAWQRGLQACDFRTRYLCAKLLAVKTFRSAFRASLRDQVVAWLETPAAERRTTSPLSARQLNCLEYRAFEVDRAMQRIYADRRQIGRLLTIEEAHAMLEAARAA